MEAPKNDVPTIPKYDFNIHDIVFLGYFDVSEYVSNSISLLQHLLNPTLESPKFSHNCIVTPLSPYKGNVPKMGKKCGLGIFFENVSEGNKMILKVL